MNIYLLGGMLALLAIGLVALALKLVAMVRAGRPLLAVGRLQWHLPRRNRNPAPRPAEEPQPDVQMRARFQNLVTGVERPEAEAKPYLQAEAGLEDEDQPTAAAEAEPDCAAAIERRIEAEFDRYCDGEIDLPAFEAALALIEAELRSGSVQEEDQIGQAESVIAWCKDWVRQQQLAA